MTSELKDRGFHINKKSSTFDSKIRDRSPFYTREPRRYSSYRGKVGKVAKHRIRHHFYTNICHQKITTDTTEFKYVEIDTKGVIRQRKLYLDPFMDMYNSEILSYRISGLGNDGRFRRIHRDHADCPYRRTFHSEQGWTYQMKSYRQKLKKQKIFRSMSRKGNCLNNSIIENFFSLLEQEIFHGEAYHSFDELETVIDDYIYYYNNHRMKQKLNWKSPVQFRKKLHRKRHNCLLTHKKRSRFLYSEISLTF